VKKNLPAYVYPKGKRGYLYFIRPGICHRMKSAPGTADFAAEYAALLRGKVAPAAVTIGKMIDAYQRSPEWAKLAGNTRKSYRRHLDYFREKIGSYDPDRIRTKHLNDMRDALADKPTDANRKIACLSALYRWGQSQDWCKANPAIVVKKLAPTGRKRGPWPQDLIDAARATATGRDLLLFEMLIGTGQRIGDVLAMRWGDFDGEGIAVKQGKTGASIYVPLTDRLRRLLEATPRKGFWIVCQANGQRVSYNLAWKDMMALRVKIGAEAFDIHSLRHSAASEIASLPGMTADHVRAITGHSAVEMVRLYAGKAMQKARAKEAQAARNGTGPERESGKAN
jgi:integrase